MLIYKISRRDVTRTLLLAALLSGGCAAAPQSRQWTSPSEHTAPAGVIRARVPCQCDVVLRPPATGTGATLRLRAANALVACRKVWKV